MRSGRGPHDEYSRFVTSTYPKLVAQLVAITGDPRAARAAATTTLARTWRAWPALRNAPDRLVRTRWTAVVVAAEQEQAGAPQARPVGPVCADDEGAVVVAALQLLPAAQRRAVVLHHMGGVSATDLATLSGSSAEQVEQVLEDGFAALAGSLTWAEHHMGPRDGSRDPDLRCDWAAEALADTAVRLCAGVIVPSPARLVRHAALTRLAGRILPVAAVSRRVGTVARTVAPRTSSERRPALCNTGDRAAEQPAVMPRT